MSEKPTDVTLGVKDLVMTGLMAAWGITGCVCLTVTCRSKRETAARMETVAVVREALDEFRPPLLESDEHRETLALREGAVHLGQRAPAIDAPGAHPFTDADLDTLPNPATRHYGPIDPTGLPVDDYAAMVMLADWCLDLSYCPRCDARTPLCACPRDSDGELLEEQASDMVEEIRDSEVLGALRVLAESPEGRAFLAEVRKLYAGESLEKAVTVRALAAELWKLDPVTRDVVEGVR